LYKLVATDEETEAMRANYLAGNYGYGHAKQAFFELLITKYKTQRERYWYFMDNLSEIDKALAVGAQKAQAVASNVLLRTRAKLGY